MYGVRRTLNAQLICRMGSCSSVYCLFVSFVLFEPKPLFQRESPDLESCHTV